MRVLDFSSASADLSGGEAHWPIASLEPGTVVCLGTFDGMHRGHQGLIARARSLGERVGVVTFEPRPVEVLLPERAPPRLQTPGQREHVCRELGVDVLVILPFDREVSRLSPAAFVEKFLIHGLRPATVVVGYDFHFGASRAGGPTELRALLEPAGVAVSVVEKIEADPDDGEKLGSTAIRQLVRAGQVGRAAELLGRFYAVAGVVEHGAERGRVLGYPTANVASDSLHPASGVYACFLSLLDDAGVRELEHWPAVANLGSNPTFTGPTFTGPTFTGPTFTGPTFTGPTSTGPTSTGPTSTGPTSTGPTSTGPTFTGPTFTGGEPGAPPTLEVHAFDVDLGARLYGRAVEVAFVERLRDEVRFDGVEALREAIARDIEAARPLLHPDRAAYRWAQVVEASPDASISPPPLERASAES